MRSLILRSFQSPGDVLMLTAAVRDLHAAHPGKFRTDVRTAAEPIWLHNPHRTPLREGEAGVEILDMHYPLIHQSNQRPYHFIHGYVQYLEEKLQLRIPVTKFHGDIHLAAEEKRPLNGPAAELGDSFWIIVAGGKYDFTAKWWNPAGYQEVVDHFQGKIQFAQCGEEGHWHPRLNGVVDLVGKTGLRDFIRLMYHAAGVVCPVTLAMHLAAAVETRPGRRLRPCVVIAGGREPPHWEAYPQHQLLSTVGALPCCAHGGCWKSRCQLVGDGDPKDRHDVCEHPVQLRPDLRIPRCMDMITPADVIRRIDYYLDGGVLVEHDSPRAHVRPGPLPGSQTPFGNHIPETLFRLPSRETEFPAVRSQTEFGNERQDGHSPPQPDNGERYYQEHKSAGLDYLSFGDWQEQYGRWFVDVLGLRGKRVLDVGCACGAIVRGLYQAGALVHGVDTNEHMIQLGRKEWPDLAGNLFTCDAVNLHPFADACCHAAHVSQTAQHWKPDLVTYILRELARVTAPDGLLFCSFDQQDVAADASARGNEAPACVRPVAWWHERLEEAGWQVCSDDFERPLRMHPASFLNRYNWVWFIARRGEQT